jgi:cell division protease FtsH
MGAISKQIENIKQKKEQLVYASEELKKHFIGMDSIIDRVIKDIEVWYTMPQLLNRPVVICLWGMTGVGKTDFVRKLVNLLDFKDKFTEIQLMNSGSYTTTISEELEASNFATKTPGILLLDEIQRFRSINNRGEDIHEYIYQDVWDILSDGHLSCDSDVDFMKKLLFDFNKSNMPTKSKGKKVKDEAKDVLAKDYLGEDYWSVKSFKDALKLDESAEEISTWSKDRRAMTVKARLADKSIYQDADYTKLLIFISGNLDEAFEMAEGVDDVNLDADIYHDFSKKISLIDIKKALKERFKPEQISRFGNVHIIYPSLSKLSYELIIEREIGKICTRLKDEFDIKVSIDNSINKLIYENGVFPVQGVRPVFSTISEILESTLPSFCLESMMKSKKSFKISYDDVNIVASIGKHVVKTKYEGQIDSLKRKRRKNKHFITMLAVHEAGHAINYALEYKVAPVQIAIDVASAQDGADAFVGCHENGYTKGYLKKNMIVCMGGLAAEKLVFKDGGRGAGVSNDLLQATATAGQMIRNYGMDYTSSYIVASDSPHADDCNTDIDASNDIIDKLVRKAEKKSRKNIKKHLPLFYDIVDRLVVKGQMMPEEFKAICSSYALSIELKDNDAVLDLNYATMYEDFKK